MPGWIARHAGRAWVVAACGVVFGSLGLAWTTYDIARIPWELDARSPTVQSSSASCGTFAGALYTIEVGGQSYTCLGAETKCPAEQHVLIAYDAQRPERCRVADRVGRPTLDQLNSLFAALVWLGFAGVVFTSPGPDGLAIGSFAPGIGYRLSRGVFVLALLLGIVTLLQRFAGQGVVP